MGPHRITATQFCETILTILFSTVLWNRIRSDPKLLAGSGKIIPDPDPGRSGSEMNLKKNYSEKLIKNLTISQKMLNLKM
jgi:hypothetical protein